MERILCSMVDPSFALKRDYSIFAKVELPSQALLQHREHVANSMLLMWALCSNHFRMARMFWQRGADELPSCLIASRILRKMAAVGPMQRV